MSEGFLSKYRMRISNVCWRYCGGAGASISEGSRRAAQKRIQKCYLIESSTCHVYTGFSDAVVHNTAHSVRAQDASSSFAIFDRSANIVWARGASSHTVFHHTASIKRAHKVVYVVEVVHHTAHSVRAQEAASSFAVFDQSAKHRAGAVSDMQCSLKFLMDVLSLRRIFRA